MVKTQLLSFVKIYISESTLQHILSARITYSHAQYKTCTSVLLNIEHSI